MFKRNYIRSAIQRVRLGALEVKTPPFSGLCKQGERNKNKNKKLLITLLSVGLVWLIATTVFVVLLLAFPGVQKSWMCYIYALPVSAIVLVVFSVLWAKPIWQFLSSTILIWTTLVSICLSISDIWYLLLIGAPLEILLFLLFVLKKK